MKNTTKLEETVEELKNCKGCKGLHECKNKVKGYIYYPEEQNKILKFLLCTRMQPPISELKFRKQSAQ